MPIYAGTSNKNQQAISVGARELGRVWVGDMLVWEKKRGFIFTINVPAGQAISLPLVAGAYIYDFKVAWGDGSVTGTVTSFNDVDATHVYAVSGNYVVTVKGTCQAFAVNNSAIKPYVTSVVSWGYCDFRELNFNGCSNLQTLPMGSITGAVNCTSVNSFISGCTSLTGPINKDWFKLMPSLIEMSSLFMGTNVSGPIPEDLFWGNPNVLYIANTFANCRELTGAIPEKLFRYNPKLINVSYCFSIGGYVSTNFSGTVPRDLFFYNPELTTVSWLFRWNWSNLTIPNGLFRNNLKITDYSLAFYRCAYMKIGRYPFSAIDPDIPGDTEVLAAYRRFAGKTINFIGFAYTDQYYGGAKTRYAPEIWDPAIYDMTTNTHDVYTFYSPANVYSNQASIPVGWK